VIVAFNGPPPDFCARRAHFKGAGGWSLWSEAAGPTYSRNRLDGANLGRGAADFSVTVRTRWTHQSMPRKRRTAARPTQNPVLPARL